MRAACALLLLAVVWSGLAAGGGAASTTNLTFVSDSTTALRNPDRGWYVAIKHTGDFSSTTLTTLARQYSTMQYLAYLTAYKTQPIDNTFFNLFTSNMNALRTAGFKVILRFAYTDTDTVDATLTQIQSHLDQIQPYLLANADIISGMQAGLVGQWGEFQGSTNFGADSWPPNVSSANKQQRKAVIDKMLAVMPEGKFVQVRQPWIKMQFYRSTPVQDNEAYNGADYSRVGQFNDCFLCSSDDGGTYWQQSSEETFLEQDTKWVPMSGETALVNSPRSLGPSAISVMARFHWSLLHAGYNTDVYATWTTDEKAIVTNRLGYRLRLVWVALPTTLVLGSSAHLTLRVANDGFAAPYAARTVYLIFRSGSGIGTATILRSVALPSIDWRRWQPGVTTAEVDIVVPSDLPAGTYTLALHFPDPHASIAARVDYAVRLANTGTMWESTTGYNLLTTTQTVVAPSPSAPVASSTGGKHSSGVSSTGRALVAFSSSSTGRGKATSSGPGPAGISSGSSVSSSTGPNPSGPGGAGGNTSGSGAAAENPADPGTPGAQAISDAAGRSAPTIATVIATLAFSVTLF